VLERGGVVQQWTGEAWSGVALTLSNARPAERRAPGELWPDLRRIVPPMAPMPAAPRAKVAAESDAAAGYAPPVAEPSVIVADTGHDGPTVIYRYPRPVDLASDVEGVRLALDELALLPEISARAVPRLDDTAFLIARARNDTGQVLLPGTAALFLDGAWIGDADLPLTPEAGEVELAFGAIDGLRLSRRVPERETGDRGVLSRSNRHDETAVIEVRNLTPEPWQVRVLDSVPYSEQEDLRIDWRAEPAPDETDVDGARGILAWDLRLPAGGTGTIRIGHSIAWPEGMVLQ
jgi:uncharacterized protein (TIGR02231 family)